MALAVPVPENRGIFKVSITSHTFQVEQVVLEKFRILIVLTRNYTFSWRFHNRRIRLCLGFQ